MGGERAADAPLERLRLLADETRWRLVRALRVSDRLVGELAEELGMPQNLISYHLAALRQAGLVRLHRSDADGRASYYGLELAALAQLYDQIGAALAVPAALGRLSPAPPPALTVLFLCRANSARSQIAEGWLRALGGGRIAAHSAGTQPAALHPLAAQAMAEAGVDISRQRAKHADELAELAPDLVITVCDIAREECAHWQRAGARLHWSTPDPARAHDLGAFRAARDELRERVQGLLALLPSLAG